MTWSKLPDKMEPLYNYLESLYDLLEEIPGSVEDIENGDVTYRTWNERALKNVENELVEIFKIGNPLFLNYKNAISEVKQYLIESFGSHENLNYGPLNELNFIAFLYSLCKIGIYNREDYEALVNQIF